MHVPGAEGIELVAMSATIYVSVVSLVEEEGVDGRDGRWKIRESVCCPSVDRWEQAPKPTAKAGFLKH